MKVFLKPNASNEEIDAATVDYLVFFYGGKEGNTLAECRYEAFVKGSVKRSFSLADLPPTTDAAIHHGRRAYFQVQIWKGQTLDPLQWGWRMSPNGLMPVMTLKEPAPKCLLDTMSCRCKKG